MIVYAVVDDALLSDFPLGLELEVFIRREDAERFIEEVGGDDPRMAAKLRIEQRELEAGGLNRHGNLNGLLVGSRRGRLVRRRGEP